MTVLVREFTDEWTRPVREFNSRLACGKLWRAFQFPEQPPRQPRAKSDSFYEEYVLATEERAVRGAYILKHQECSFFSESHSIAHYRLPLSEGVVNRAYATVGVQLLRDALAREPLLFALGMGDQNKPLPRMLKALGWSLTNVPFFFKVNYAAPFLRNIRTLRTSPLRKTLLDLAAFTGAGAMALSFLRLFQEPSSAAADTQVDVVPVFGAWADALWEKNRSVYAMAAVRDQAFLNSWYPAEDHRLLRLKISLAGRVAGWALVLDTQMKDDRYFGDMRVGSIADSFADPADAGVVVAAAANFLDARGVDLIVANQSHFQWKRAFRRAGFLEGPSNFTFAASPELTERIGPVDVGAEQIYLNRGDGDGPMHFPATVDA